MKKIFFLIFIFFLTVSVSKAETELLKNFDEQIIVNEPYTAKLVTTAVLNPKFDIAELLPVGWEIIEWDVSGNSSEVTFEKSFASYLGSVREIYRWGFSEPAPNGVEVTYTAIPRRGGNFNITTILTYTDPVGFDLYNTEIYVAGGKEEIMCGNGICEAIYGESSKTCPEDCKFDKIITPYMWLAILGILLLIIFIGLAIKACAVHKTLEKKSFKEEAIEEEPVFPEEISEQKTEEIKEIPKKMPKKLIRKSKKGKNKEREHTKFYEKTLKKLEKIKKELK